jgi:ribosomally synthesized peptide (two-chain TOMM family)
MSGSQHDDFMEFQAAIARAISIAWNDDNNEFKKDFFDDPIGAMKKHFQYDCPFDVRMTANPSDEVSNPHHFDPTHTGGWVGTNNTIRLFLPPAPKDPKQKAEALAAFNQARVLFLSRK